MTGGGNYTVLSSRCEQRRESGLCRANLPRWHYDPHFGSCHRFVYGGCGANLNNFVSEQQCYAVCHREEVTCPPEQTNNKTCELSEAACTTCHTHPQAVCRVDPCSCVAESDCVVSDGCGGSRVDGHYGCYYWGWMVLLHGDYREVYLI
ncbi:hypothetical protein Pmani_000290 [Petrolisthes manimaculis]|uniref:BPTI/Kunitz inhibitor domain-containing protein n=1 Tax=Petrolisthes manimaculis TaxID=1843537 RepID=A0AAE1QM91_9EUCA|nr:hypothetical protein Pmani_000290 [Petrolisthes manimaculis]